MPDNPADVELLAAAGVTLRRSTQGSVLRADFSSIPTERFEPALLQAAQRLARLRELILTGMPCDDSAVAAFERLPKLTTLDLRGTQVSDGAADRLERLTRLKWLDLSGTAVTVERIRQMRKRMIGTRIVH